MTPNRAALCDALDIGHRIAQAIGFVADTQPASGVVITGTPQGLRADPVTNGARPSAHQRLACADAVRTHLAPALAPLAHASPGLCAGSLTIMGTAARWSEAYLDLGFLPTRGRPRRNVSVHRSFVVETDLVVFLAILALSGGRNTPWFVVPRAKPRGGFALPAGNAQGAALLCALFDGNGRMREDLEPPARMRDGKAPWCIPTALACVNNLYALERCNVGA